MIELTSSITAVFPAIRTLWPSLEEHRQQAYHCLAYDRHLTDWERDFCWSVACYRYLSDKQHAVLARSYAKARGTF
jgi:hypothetical protein